MQRGTVYACPQGLYGGRHERPGGLPSIRLHRDTVHKMLKYAAPPGYRRSKPPRRPKIGPYTGVIDRILQDDLNVPKKQRHTAKRIYERLKNEHGFEGKYTIVKDYVRERRRTTREIFIPPVPSAGTRPVRLR